MSQTSSHELVALQNLALDAADEYISAMQSDANAHHYLGYPLGSLVGNLVDICDVHTAHGIGVDAVSNLQLDSSNSFHVWKSLYKKGDAPALQLARQDLGIASKRPVFVEQVTGLPVSHLHSVEKLVDLVEAGDNDLVDLARDYASDAIVTDSAALLGRLYVAGDQQSLSLAIDAAHRAKRYTEATGDTHYHRSEQALRDMAAHAITGHDFDDALILIPEIQAEDTQADLHAKLYLQGRTESLHVVLEQLASDRRERPWRTPYLDRDLARAGYKPAVRSLKKRIKQDISGYPDEVLQDLRALHDSGDDNAADIMVKIVASAQKPEYYAYQLSSVDKAAEASQILRDRHKQAPTPSIESALVEFDFDADMWRRVFNNRLGSTNGQSDSAGYEFWTIAKQARNIRA